MCPGDICPIIVSAKHFNKEADHSERAIIPALWGIVPRWHKGDYKKHGLTTNNARIEGIEGSKLYKPCLERGKRCILPVEGFYEWQTVNPKLKSSERPAYFIYLPQGSDVKIEDKSTWSKENVNLMFVAGIFDIWHDEHGDSLYSFTIITYESDDHFKWLHHRTPAILETEAQIEKWLNFEDFPSEAALKLIKHPSTIIWHQVSKYVNSSKNKSSACNKQISDTKSVDEKPNSLMAWMKRKVPDDSKEDSKNVKKIKQIE